MSFRATPTWVLAVLACGLGSTHPLSAQGAAADSAGRLRAQADSVLEGQTAADLQRALGLRVEALALYRRSRNRRARRCARSGSCTK
jgi:hypothetical protein